MKAFVRPFWLVILLGALAGGFAGFGAYTFRYARGASYLSDNPAACVNCHVMREVFEAWNHGSHKAIATCNDCHSPENFLGHWVVKGLNGWRHSRAFTLGDFHDPIRIIEFNKKVARKNCIRCHGEMTAFMDHRSASNPTDCLFCHAEAGHSY